MYWHSFQPLLPPSRLTLLPLSLSSPFSFSPFFLPLQVSDTLATAENLLGDLNGYNAFYRETVELKDELYDYQREQFDGWSRQTLGAIDSKASSLSLETSGRLMELGKKDGKLRVYYSDRLVALLREVRQLLAFGFPVSAKIQHVANTAQKFYRHAVVLKQVSEWSIKSIVVALHVLKAYIYLQKYIQCDLSLCTCLIS